MKKLYHKDIYLPQEYIEQSLKQQWNTPFFELTKHAFYNVNKQHDVHHSVKLSELNYILGFIRHNPISPFEVEVTDGIVTKYCVKFETKTHGVAIVIRGNKVITVYSNPRGDKHKTLDYALYDID